ncbi:hypothetical protein QTP32_11790 [Xanthomonas citri pv. citri]
MNKILGETRPLDCSGSSGKSTAAAGAANNVAANAMQAQRIWSAKADRLKGTDVDEFMATTP